MKLFAKKVLKRSGILVYGTVKLIYSVSSIQPDDPSSEKNRTPESSPPDG